MDREVSPELIELAQRAVAEELADIDLNAREGPLVRRRNLVELQARLAERLEGHPWWFARQTCGQRGR